MHVQTYIYDAESAADHVDRVRERLRERDEEVEFLDVAAADDRTDAVREAMFAIRESIRIGTAPDAVYDEHGAPDFSAGVLITQAPTGRRSVHVGRDALEALEGGSAE